ncbi:MAG: hypothetical protein H6855_03380 [Rhodospirillales bacterium]|nr:hypothetical protein [Rhodospirillales bacterium]MCB9973580.1 hypothetical protein [Rhodospirillales bacterium]MCB9979616.1 hypothetical protein [Rhodospirillales bacterium]
MLSGKIKLLFLPLLAGVFLLTGCGIKPDHLSPPSEKGPAKEFPATYPAEQTL